MAVVKRLCVYCGSSDRVEDSYRAAAYALGTMLGAAGIELVFGGGRVGLMGRVADGVLAAGGRAIGIIPGHLHEREVGHSGVSELVVVGSMHERKQRMFELADAFVILPGGLGTLDETFEIITWKQLELHDKPVVIVNANGYWRPLIGLIEHVVTERFTAPAALGFYHVVPSVADVLPLLAQLPEPTLAAESKLV